MTILKIFLAFVFVIALFCGVGGIFFYLNAGKIAANIEKGFDESQRPKCAGAILTAKTINESFAEQSIGNAQASGCAVIVKTDEPVKAKASFERDKKLIANARKLGVCRLVFQRGITETREIVLAESKDWDCLNESPKN